MLVCLFYVSYFFLVFPFPWFVLSDGIYLCVFVGGAQSLVVSFFLFLTCVVFLLLLFGSVVGVWDAWWCMSIGRSF